MLSFIDSSSSKSQSMHRSRSNLQHMSFSQSVTDQSCPIMHYSLFTPKFSVRALISYEIWRRLIVAWQKKERELSQKNRSDI